MRFSPPYGGFGAIFFGPASSAQLGLRFSLFDTSIYLGFCRGDGSSYMRCQPRNRGPDKPHDAHDVGLLGAAGALTSAANASKTLKIRAVGSTSNSNYQHWQHLYCMTSMRMVLSAVLRLNHVNNTFCIAFHCFLLVKDRN